MKCSIEIRIELTPQRFCRQSLARDKRIILYMGIVRGITNKPSVENMIARYQTL